MQNMALPETISALVVKAKSDPLRLMETIYRTVMLPCDCLMTRTSSACLEMNIPKTFLR